MIRIDIDDREVRRALERLARRVADLRPAMRDIGESLTEGMRRRIGEGRDWDGRAFAPNSPLTAARKGRNAPLVDTGSFAGQRLHYAAGRDFVEVDFVTARPKRRTNAIESAYLVPLSRLRERVKGGQVRLLWGTLE